MPPSRPGKRDEVGRVAQQLKDPEVQRDPMRKRKAMQRVIALMTVGMDASSLFMDVILACFTSDIVTKKLIYLYLTTYSSHNEELAVLTINTFVKECADENPLVRALALRSLASLRVPQLLEYLLPILTPALQDYSPYVRRTAVMCMLRVYHLSPSEFASCELYGKLQTLMMRDTDPLVCIDAVQTLREINAVDQDLDAPVYASFVVTKPLLYNLLNRLPKFDPWQQTTVVDLVHEYSPATEEEMFDIMNALEDRLQSRHTGLVIAVSRAFLHLTQNSPDVYLQVLERLREPLLAMMASTQNIEAAYAVLCHVKLIIRRVPEVYRAYYKHFFCRYLEPTYMKIVKMSVLADLADAQSASAIVKELAVYTEDRRFPIAQAAVRGLCHVALRLPDSAVAVLGHLLDSLRYGSEQVRGATLVALKDFLRRFRNVDVVVKQVLEVLLALFQQEGALRDDTSLQALVWVLGEFGEHVENAPYIIELLSAQLLSRGPEFRLQMLTSAIKLFFKKPPEMQPILGAVFKILIDDFSNADVLDKALLYYRMLQHGPTTAVAQIVCAEKAPLSLFVEDLDTAYTDRLLEEFGSLSVVYGIPSEKFVKASSSSPLGDGEDEEDEGEAVYDGGASSHDSTDKDDDRHHHHHSRQEEGDVTAIGNLFPPANTTTAALLPMTQTQAPAASLVGAESNKDTLSLSDTIELGSAEYQQHWGALTTSTALAQQVHQTAASSIDGVEDHLAEYRIYALASGKQDGTAKLYLYAGNDEGSQLFLVELLVSSTGRADATVKSASPQLPEFMDVLRGALAELS